MGARFRPLAAGFPLTADCRRLIADNDAAGFEEGREVGPGGLRERPYEVRLRGGSEAVLCGVVLQAPEEGFPPIS